MSAEQFDRLRRLLSAAVHLPWPQRADYLRHQCPDDALVLDEALSLVELYDSADGFLSRPFPEILGARAAEPVHLPPGTLLNGRFRIEEKISQSSFATVYLAVNVPVGEKLVVIKVLDQFQTQAALAETFAAELKSLGRMHHPNVVGISDVGTLDSGVPFLVLHYVPGATLREVLRHGPLPIPRALSLVKGIGRALTLAHQAGIWHLDLKPENIIVSDPDSAEERITLIDFGIARLKSLGPDAGPDTTMVASSLVAGSLRYMAPEQESAPSAQCDIYSLSLVAFEVLAGHLPYPHTKPHTRVEDQLPPRLGNAARRAIAQGLQPDPSRRFAQVPEFLAALQKAPAPPQRRFVNLSQAALLSLMVAAYAWRFPTQPSGFYAPPASLVSTQSQAHQPSFSADGTEIYYSVGYEGAEDIYRKSISGGDPILVVGHPADDRRPQVSPDGRQLIFTRIGERIELRLMPLPSGPEQLLLAGVDVDTYSWSADSQRIIFSSIVDGRLSKLRVLEISSGKLTDLVLSAPDCAHWYPRVSPNGQTLAFSCRWSPGSDDLFIADIHPDLTPRGPARRITHERARIHDIAWAPDSQSLLYVGGPLDTGVIWRAFPFGGPAPAPVTSLPDVVAHLDVPRHSWKLAYSHFPLEDTNLWTVTPSHSRPPQRVPAGGSYTEGEGRFSPDGQSMLFISVRSGRAQVWIARADGSGARPITNLEPVDVAGAIWAANSREVIVSTRSKDDGERIYRATTEGPPALTPLLRGAMASNLSADGHWLYLVKSKSAQRSLWRTPYPAANRQELIADGGAFGVESPDGRTFYFAQRDEAQGIWRKSLPDGQAIQVVPKLLRRNLFALSPTGIFYISPLPGQPLPALFFQSFAGGPPQRLLAFDREIGWGLDLSPDGKTLLYTQVDSGSSDLKLVSEFR